MIKKPYKLAAACITVAALLTGCVTSGASNDNLTIGKYEGVEVKAVEGILEIDEETIDMNIQKVLEGFAGKKEVTEDRASKEGDIITIDYVTKVDGEKIPSGCDSDFDVELGTKAFFEGFMEELIGKKIGETVEMEHSFSKTFGDEYLAGKDAVVSATIKKISEKELPDLTDDFVQKISQKSKTVKEYRKEMKEVLEEQNHELVMNEVRETAWQAVLDNTEIHQYPKEQLDAAKQEYIDHYQDGADIYRMELKDFVKKQLDMDEAEFDEYVTSQAKQTVRDDLIVALISEKEKISLTEEEYAKAKEELAKEMSYDSVEEMEKEAPEAAIERYIKRDLVIDWVAEHAIQKKD